MKAETNFFEHLDNGLDEFFSSNPTADEVEKAIQYINSLMQNHQYGIAMAGLKYVLARLEGAK